MNRKLSIVYLIARFYPYKGGAEENCYQLAKRAAAAGHQVTVLTTNANPLEGKLPSQEYFEGMQIIRIKRWNQQLVLGFYPGLLLKLLSIKADVIHVENGPGFFWQEFCLFLKRILSWQTKFLVTPHGGFIVTPDTHKGIKRFIAKVAKLVCAPYFKFIWPLLWDNVIQVNPKQEIWLRRDYGIRSEEINLIPNGIEKAYIDNQKQLNNKLNQLENQEAPEIGITYLGRLASYKRVHDLITAFALLKQANAKLNLKLRILGKPETGYLEKLDKIIQELEIKDVVEILQAPDNELRDTVLTKQSHVLVLPSEWEATGIVLLEAMAKGNAVLTSTGNEAAELLITQGVNGYIFTTGDTEGLAQKLEQVVNDKNKLAQIAKTNWSSSQKFTWEMIYPKYEELLQSLATS